MSEFDAYGSRSVITDPMAVIESLLLDHAEGRPVDEERFSDACLVATAVGLVQAGVSLEAVEAMFSRPHSWRVEREADGRLAIEAEFHDEDPDG